MSWHASAYVRELDQGITRSEKLLLFVIADFHNTDLGFAFASRATLARDALMSERQLYRLTNSLMSKGFLVIQSRAGARRSNRYFLPGLNELNTDMASGLPKSQTLTSGGPTLTFGGKNPDTIVSGDPKNRQYEPKRSAARPGKGAPAPLGEVERHCSKNPQSQAAYRAFKQKFDL